MRRPAVPVHTDYTWVLFLTILLTRTRLRHLIARTILTELECHVQECISASTNSLRTQTDFWRGFTALLTYLRSGGMTHPNCIRVSITHIKVSKWPWPTVINISQRYSPIYIVFLSYYFNCEQLYSLRLSLVFSCASFCCLPPRSRHNNKHMPSLRSKWKNVGWYKRPNIGFIHVLSYHEKMTIIGRSEANQSLWIITIALIKYASCTVVRHEFSISDKRELQLYSFRPVIRIWVSK